MPLRTKLLLLGLLQAEVTVGLVPVVGRDGVVRLGVVRLDGRPLREGLDRLLELFLAVVEPGELQVDLGVVRAGLLCLQEHLFGLRVVPGVLADLGEGEVVVRVLRIELDHAVDDGLLLGRVVQFVRTVSGNEELEGTRPERLVRLLLAGELIVLDGLGQVGVVFRLTLAGRLEEVVVAVGEIEVGHRQPGVVGDRLLVQRGGLLELLLLIQHVGVLERPLGLELSVLAAADHPRGERHDERQRRDPPESPQHDVPLTLRATRGIKRPVAALSESSQTAE